jgi:mono/diheme cytochrome c family protein
VLLFAAMLLLVPARAGAQGPATPSQTPDAELGLEIFGARCANCHGTLGRGDGELASQLPQPPASLANEAFTRQAVPSDLFATITNGIVPSGMPPFGPDSTNPVSEQDRWNLVAAIYALGTSQASVEAGEAIYEESCASCHGDDGAGAGPDLGAPDYWLQQSNESLFNTLSAGDVPEHEEYDLSNDELWTVIDYARTLSYQYANPMAAFEPIASATISGTVTNESTGEMVEAGTPVVLNAYTPDFDPSLTLTTTVDSTGQYQFDLEMVAPDLVYIVSLVHEGLNQGSDFQRIERSDPALNLPVSVYDTTTDDSAVRIGQLHVILEFAGDSVQVSELYQFVQNAPYIYVGSSGEPAEGTVVVTVPDEATTPSFDRSFGNLDSFFPVESMVEMEDGWADTLPLRPEGVTNLLVSYVLPYDGGVEIAHEVNYGVDRANLVFPEVGVSLANADEELWISQGAQSMGQAGTFLNFTRPDLLAGATLAITLEGTPSQTAASTPGGRDLTRELLIGGGVLLLVVAVGIYFLRTWQQGQAAPAAAGPVETVAVPAPGTKQPPTPETSDRREELLRAIAALDDAYEEGELEQSVYESRRRALKDELLAVWPQE